MIIVADRDILAVTESFQAFGELRLVPGREICAEDVRHADALIVRSVTRVDKALLAGSDVQFVATATSGTDHLDIQWLSASGIHVADAAGANANAVVEYVVYALCDLLGEASHEGLTERLKGKRLSVIGAGNVGSRLLRQCILLGIDCVACDPFVSQLPGELADLPRCDLDSALRSDVISLHVPLTDSGPHATRHMLDADRISALAAGTVLINTARGEVVDTDALKSRIEQQGDITAVLDVFPGEPEIDRDLCESVAIATPHIAGYSVDAKMAATQRVLAAFCMYFDLPMFEAGPIQVIGQAMPGAIDECEEVTRFSPATVGEEFCHQVKATPKGESLAPVFDGMRRLLAGRVESGINRAASPTSQGTSGTG